MAEQEHLNGIVMQVVFQSMETGFCVLELLAGEDTITVVGDLAGTAPGEELHLTGSYVEHASFGRQFKATACEYRLPDTAAAIQQYLSSGVIPGLGPVTAKRIVEVFGADTLTIMQTAPAQMAKRVKGISYAKAQQLSRDFCELIGLREAIEELGKLGVNAAAAMQAYRQYGPDTVERIHQNPYLLCAAPVFLPFGQADEAAASLQLDPQGDYRVHAALLYVLRHNLNNGHTCLPKDKLLSTTATFLSAEPERVQSALRDMTEEAEVLLEECGKESYVYLPEYFRAEFYAASRLKEMCSLLPEPLGDAQKSLDRLELLEGVHYAPLQREAVFSALRSHVFVLTGGPGTGKTTAVNAILALLEERQLSVSLAAPTGRAAKRLSEVTGRKASTIHRLLEVDPKSRGEQLQFMHNEEHPLRADAVIVDEMSMVDALLFESLLCALKPSCRLILIGDADQLPSVGAGNVLKGIVESKVVPTVCLKEIFRQAAQSRIVSNAHRIVEGKLPENGAKTDDFFFMQTDGLRGPDLICDLVSRRLPASYGFSCVNDIQVLCPTKLGPLGTEQLNRRLQQQLNPASSEKKELVYRGVTYREGDKVMQIRNDYDICYRRDDGEEGTGAFNGDIGVIETVNRRGGTLKVRFEDKIYFYEGEALSEVELAYAVTVHKSQGSEFDAVVLPLAEVPLKLCYRNLLYTAVTRAKKLLVIAGQPFTLAQMVENDRKILRFSCFAALLRDDSVS